MAQSNFFPSRPDLTPQIYAYSDPRYEGMLKVGYTTRDVQNWMRNRNTIEFLGLWESLHNPAFNRVQFDTFRTEAGLNRFVMPPSKWIEQTGAVGTVRSTWNSSTKTWTLTK